MGSYGISRILLGSSGFIWTAGFPRLPRCLNVLLVHLCILIVTYI